MHTAALALLLAFPPLLTADVDDPAWSGFRGTNGTGNASGSIPAALDPEMNLTWRVEIPAGYSSPAIAGDLLFLTGADGNELFTICLDRIDGAELWRKQVSFDGRRPGANSPAAPSPATDGERVFSLFHSFGIVAYDTKGEELWSHEIGPFNIPHGMSSSPVLHNELVMLQVDQDESAYLVAYDKASGKEQSIRIEGAGGLDSSEIDRMVEDAEANAAADKDRREAIEKKNELDSMIYQAEKLVSENGDKLDDDEKSSLEQVLTDAKADLESGDVAKLDAAKQRVEAELHKVAEKLYKSEAAGAEGMPPNPGAPEGGAGAGASADDDVIDAEFTDTSDKS